MSNFAYIILALLKRGPLFPLFYVKEALAFDLRHGTDTHLRVPKSDELGTKTERADGVLYVASWTSVVRRALTLAKRLLGPKQFQESQFFDLGCGKGKALLVYALDCGHQAKETAIGIEYEPALCETARENAGRLRAVTDRMAIHCDSALNLERYIKSKPFIVYLYNPFQGDTLKSMLNILSKHPHLLIYVDPVAGEVLPDYGYVIHTFHQGRYHADTWLLASNQISIRSPFVA